MAHKYYCTHCARELDQEKVLLDMEPALTVSNDERFSVLKFRILKSEFDAMIATGTKGDLGFVHCELPFAKFVEYLSDKRNLADPVIKELTLLDIDEFLKGMEKAEYETSGEAENSTMNIFDPQINDKEPEQVWAPGIEALRNKNTTVKGEKITDQMLVGDLKRIQTFFAETGSVKLVIKPRTEKADDGDDVLIGYLAKSGQTQIPVEARVCCHCDAQVFEHAGTAEHRSIAFIGEPSSGKTSTILAMTHYAQNAARNIKSGDPVWTGSYSIPGIDFIRVLSVDTDLYHDLKLYGQGIAPEKADLKRRDDAYSSTLWIVNKWDQKFLLTLNDLPGELCKEDGTIDSKRIMNEFPIALASDAFVMCFDAVEAEYAKPRNLIWRTLSWANEFQKLRREYKKDSVIRLPDGTTPELTDDCMAPMMVAFTKCRELESEAALREVEMVRKFETDRVKDIYCLKAEREYIYLNPVYQRLGTAIRVYENLKNAYIARLRISPYGFAAPKKYDYDGSIKVPSPQHIAELMQWLLMITGCVPVPAEYIPNAQDTDRRCRLENVFVRGAQYRILPPQGKTYEEKMNAAMCRAYLFENCSEQDCDIIQRWQRWGINKTFREKLSEVFRGLTRK